ncbi:sodium- and chloride-dependent GABA transporter 1-like [Clavelina lepadiformis]|uniref:sodium- and chloride-dependent GABA transporter 1-like n=1 Tax=Clavelina lepadiformis TaxID=159417 RepID=UPI0040420294
MVGSSRVRQLMVLIWKYFGPMICLAIFIYYVTAHSPLSYGSYVYPPWAQAICHVVASSSAACIPLYAVYIIFTKKTSWPQMRRREEIERTDKDTINEEEYVEML